MSDPAGRMAVSVRITGRVQGVSYRHWTRTEATRLGLTGWVRNEEDGSVSALLAGAPAAVSEMIGLCRFGPRLARVVDVETRLAAPVPPEGEEDAGFAILR